MKTRYFIFFSEFSRGSIIRGQFPDSRAKTRGITLNRRNRNIEDTENSIITY